MLRPTMLRFPINDADVGNDTLRPTMLRPTILGPTMRVRQSCCQAAVALPVQAIVSDVEIAVLGMSANDMTPILSCDS